MKTEYREPQWERERNNLVLYGAVLSRSDVVRSLCVCLSVCSCQCHREEKKTKKNESLWGEKKAWFLIIRLLVVQSMAISTVPGVERQGILGKGKPRLRKRSILRSETRSVGYLLSIDLMMLEKHLTLVLNWGSKSTAHGVFLPLSCSGSPFFFHHEVRKKLKLSTNKQTNKQKDWLGHRS